VWITFRRGLIGLLLIGAPGPGAPAAEPVSRLEVVGAGTPDAWIAREGAPVFGFGIAPEGILASIPAEGAAPAETDYRDFSAWAVPRGITLVRSHPPFTGVEPAGANLLQRGSDGRFDPARFNDEYFARLRAACTRFRDLGMLVQLRIWDAADWRDRWEACVYHPSRLAAVPWAREAGPGRFVVDPERAPGLIAHQKEHLRRVLDATGDLGNVLYELATGIGDGFGESAAWVEAMLDEAAAWEAEHGGVLVGLEDDGSDGAAAGRPASNPRLDVVFLDPARPELHAAVRAAHGKPTLAGEVRGLRGSRDPALSPEGAAQARRTLWRAFVSRCQIAGVATEWGASAYRTGPLAAQAPETVPGNDVGDVRSIWAPADTSPERVVESGTAVARVLLLPGRNWFGRHREPARGWVLLEGDPGERGREHPAARLRLRGLSYLAEDEPRRLTVRTIPLDAAAGEEQTAGFRIDDLLVDVPAFGDALVVSLRQRFVPDFVQYLAPPPGLDADVALRAAVDGQSVTLEWDRNPVANDWSGSVAWVQRLPGAERLACTSGTTFVDRAPPGKHVYMLAWREAPGSPAAVRGAHAAIVDVPDVPPAAPRIVSLRGEGAEIVLWARGEPAEDRAACEWQRRAGGGEWETLAGASEPLLRDLPPAGAGTEIRVRVRDAAGHASPFSEPVAVGP
jgi:hypothetical protein